MIPEPPANSHMTHSVVVSQRLLRCLPASVFTRHVLLTQASHAKTSKTAFFPRRAHSGTKTSHLKMCGMMERYRVKEWHYETGRNEKDRLPARNSSAITEPWGAQEAVKTDHWEQTVVIAMYFKTNTAHHHTPKWKSVSSVNDKQNGVHLYIKINGLFYHLFCVGESTIAQHSGITPASV